LKIITNIYQNSEEWLEWRYGKITGSKVDGVLPPQRKLKDSTMAKQGFWELLAEQFISSDVEDISSDARARGHQLEHDNITITQERLKLGEVQRNALWENENGIAISPDAFEANTETPTWAIECKSLNYANHFKAWFNTNQERITFGIGNNWRISREKPLSAGFQSVPDDYKYQILHYFIVNPALKKVHMAFYNPMFIAKAPQMAHFVITITREEIKHEAYKLHEYELETMDEIRSIVKAINEYLGG
jgi:hypothetical protein